MSDLVRQATCVLVGQQGLLIEGAPGSGKSSLALGLIDRGARLVGDDAVVLGVEGGRLIARPHPRTRGLIEVRGVGLVTMECAEAAPIGLVILLDPAAPRLEPPACTDIAGVTLPLLRFDPAGALLALRTELALREHGLSGS